MRNLFLALWLALAGLTPAAAQVSFGFSSPGVSIGINVPIYPRLVRVPGYPVYYAPGLRTNYFFYDGLYWVFQGDNWYESDWYNGPWRLVPPDAVPLYVLRVPVRYYRYRPSYFRGWALNAPPRWDQHWGQGWAEHHRDWNRWDRRRAPAPAPLPSYQRSYSGNRYPHADQQSALRERNYRYQPRDNAVRQRYEHQRQAPAARPQGRPAPQAHEQQQRRPAPKAQEQRREPQRAERREGPRGGGDQRDPVERWGSGG